MAIIRDIECDICKQKINTNPHNPDAVVIMGNVCIPDNEDKYGIGTGVMGNSRWVEKVEDGEAIDIDTEIPIHHIHTQCLVEYFTNKKRGA